MKDNPAPAPVARPQLSVVVPAYNEEDVIQVFHQRLAGVLDALAMSAEVIYVNDGSSDETLEALRRLQRSDPRIGVLDLSRNFGKEIAMTAGLDHSTGDAVVIIDADLQDPPELIPRLIERWREGFDVVYAQRGDLEGETRLKKVTAYGFYRLIQRMSRVRIPADTGDFRLMSRRAVDALLQLREQHRFMKGLFAWIGYPQAAVVYKRDPRYAGHSKFDYWRLWNFAIEGITSFSIAPLKIATYLGSSVALLAFAFGLVIIGRTLLFGDPVAGYPSLVVIVLFLGGTQLVFIGVLGEYLGRIFDETKRRPLYLVNQWAGARVGSVSSTQLSFDESPADTGVVREGRPAP